jgi:hypothetical protein
MAYFYVGFYRLTPKIMYNRHDKPMLRMSQRIFGVMSLKSADTKSFYGIGYLKSADTI